MFDNIVLTEYELKDGKEEAKVVLKEDFEKPQSLFEGGEIVSVGNNHKLNMVSGSGDYRVLQGAMSGVPMFRKEFKAKRKSHLPASTVRLWEFMIYLSMDSG